jgi:acetoin utilization protein AcuB
MIVSEAMNRSPVAIAPDVTVADAVALARRTGADHLLVLDERALVGILCACDLRDAPRPDPVSAWMTVPVVTIRPGARIEDAAATLRDCAVGCLPVTVGALVVGTIGDEELAACGLGPAHPHRSCHHRHAHAVP